MDKKPAFLMMSMRVLLLLILLSSLAFAESLDVDNLVADYNKNSGKMPSFVRTLFGNERINAQITLNNGTVVLIGGVTENGKIIEAKEGGIGNPTMEVFVSESALNEIQSSKDPTGAFKGALDSKRLSYRGVSTGAKIKLSIVSIAARAYFFLRGLF